MSDKNKSEEELNDDFLSGLEASSQEDVVTPASVNEAEVAKRNQMKAQLEQAQHANHKKVEASKNIEKQVEFEDTMDSHKPSKKVEEPIVEERYVVEDLLEQETETKTQATVEESVKEESPVVEEVKPKTTKKTAKPKVEKKNKIVRKSTNNEFKYVEDLFREKLDTKVKIKEHKIEISFNNVADLNRILEVLDIKE